MDNIINNRNFILGVDGGGTKTIARLENLDTAQKWQAISGPASLTNDYDAALDNCKMLLSELCAKADCKPSEVTVVFGLAGASNKEKAHQFELSISTGYKAVKVYTDAKTSLYGANLGKPIAIVSLGTGSVGAVLTAEGKEFQIGGWGFNVGDEGSGAKLGVLIVKSVLSEIEDSGNVHSLLARIIVKRFGGVLDNVLTWSTSATPSDFASLAPLVFEYQDRCHLAKNILIEHVNHVENLIKKTRSNLQLPVILLGGLSVPTIPFLSPELRSMLTNTKGNSLDGACFLAKQLKYKVSVNED
jgi:glucosamine kinase